MFESTCVLYIQNMMFRVFRRTAIPSISACVVLSCSTRDARNCIQSEFIMFMHTHTTAHRHQNTRTQTIIPYGLGNVFTPLPATPAYYALKRRICYTSGASPDTLPPPAKPKNQHKVRVVALLSIVFCIGSVTNCLVDTQTRCRRRTAEQSVAHCASA